MQMREKFLKEQKIDKESVLVTDQTEQDNLNESVLKPKKKLLLD